MVNLSDSVGRYCTLLDAVSVPSDATEKLARWFKARWDNPLSTDAVPYLALLLKESWASEDQIDPLSGLPEDWPTTSPERPERV